MINQVFSHTDIVGQLESINQQYLPIFAGMVAERLFPHAITFWGGSSRVISELRRALDCIWTHGHGLEFKSQSIDEMLETSMSAVLDAGRQDSNAAFFAENAAAAIVYGLRCIKSMSPEEAAWACQRAYDTVDRFVLMQEAQNDKDMSEVEIISHPIIQKELSRQLESIEWLKRINNKSDEMNEPLLRLRKAAEEQAESIFSSTTG